MIVDFHTHVFPEKIAERTLQALSQASNDKPYANGMIDGLLSAMEKATADLSVCLPVMTKPTQFDSLNRFAIEINERFNGQKKGIISFGGIHPLCDNIPEKMKFKLVIIYSYDAKIEKNTSEYYFVDTNKVSHIDYWKYSPSSASKIIETKF